MIDMRLAADDFDDIKVLGDYFIGPRDGKTYITLAHPSSQGHWVMVVLPIYLKDDPKPAANAWLWDGDIEKPTLTPSIHTHGHWHGYVTKGKLVSC